jgi:hypothetical protein
MSTLTKYVKRPDRSVVAIQLNLDTPGFQYRKWGSLQTCKAGDWLVDDAGQVHTVDQASFEHTYTRVGKGIYLKTAPVWARIATSGGRVRTKEGSTEYREGDMLVCNDEHGGDSYAMSAVDFEAMYEPCPV